MHESGKFRQSKCWDLLNFHTLQTSRHLSKVVLKKKNESALPPAGTINSFGNKWLIPLMPMAARHSLFEPLACWGPCWVALEGMEKREALRTCASLGLSQLKETWKSLVSWESHASVTLGKVSPESVFLVRRCGYCYGHVRGFESPPVLPSPSHSESESLSSVTSPGKKRLERLLVFCLNRGLGDALAMPA